MNWLVKALDAWWAGKVARSNAYWDQYWVGEDDVVDELWLKGHDARPHDADVCVQAAVDAYDEGYDAGYQRGRVESQ